MSRTRASLLLGLFALLWFGYPIVFYTWYFTADRVVATVEGCTKQERTCPGHGTWTMTDGSRGSGQGVGDMEACEIAFAAGEAGEAFIGAVKGNVQVHAGSAEAGE